MEQYTEIINGSVDMKGATEGAMEWIITLLKDYIAGGNYSGQD